MGKEASGPQGLHVAVCTPGDKEVKRHVIQGDQLEGMQAIVGGWLEKICRLPGKNGRILEVLVNEDGLRLGLPLNRLVRFGSMSIPVRGTILIVQVDPVTSEAVSLDEFDDMIEVLKQVASWPLPIAEVRRG